MEIRIDLSVEPGTPFSFIESGKLYVDRVQKCLSDIAEEINDNNGYVEIRQRKDGNLSVFCYAVSKELSQRMEKLIWKYSGE